MQNKSLLTILITVMMPLAACGGQQPAGSSAGSGNQTTNVTSASAPTASSAQTYLAVEMDPALAADPTSKAAVGHVYEGLITSDTNGQATGALALSVTTSEDGLDYIFVLRPGVVFHDGTKLDADAVVSNFNRWFDPKDPLHGSGAYSSWVAGFGGFKGEVAANGAHKSEVDGIQKQDTMTVLVHLNRPDPSFLTKLADPAFSIVSPAALKAAAFGTQSGVDGGSGPYKLGKWDATSLTLDPYPGYWNPALVPATSLTVTVGQ